jgi:hypothetical protein
VHRCGFTFDLSFLRDSPHVLSPLVHGSHPPIILSLSKELISLAHTRRMPRQSQCIDADSRSTRDTSSRPFQTPPRAAPTARPSR